MRINSVGVPVRSQRNAFPALQNAMVLSEHRFTPAGVAPSTVHPAVTFGKKMDTFNASEAGTLSELIAGDIAATSPDAPLSDDERKAFAEAILANKAMPQEGTFLYGVLYPDGKVKSPHPLLQTIAARLKASLPTDAIPVAGLPLVLTVRDKASFPAVKHYLEQDIIPAMQLVGDVHLKNGKKLKVHETAAWPFFQSIMSGEAPPAKAAGLVEKLKHLPIFRLKLGNVAEPVEKTVQKAFEPLKTRLAAIETARMQYTERVDVKEVLSSLTKGALVGGLGETIIHTTIHDGGVTAGAMRSGLLVMVDAIDNVYGEMGVLHSDLEANGLKMSKETIFGTSSWWQIIKNKFKMSGPGGIFAKRAVTSAAKGAATGALIAAPVGFTLSDPTASAATRALVGGPGTLGTATAIPFNIRATLPQVHYTIMHLVNEGKITVPDEIKQDPAKLKKYVRSMAEQELLSRLGFNASMKAFSLVPLSGGILALEAVGVPREALQIIFMGVAPAMENVMRLGLTLKQLKFNNPRNMAKAETMVVQDGPQELTPKGKSQLRRLFADRWSWLVNKALTVLPWPVRLPDVEKIVLETPAPQESPETGLPVAKPAEEPALK